MKILFLAIILFFLSGCAGFYYEKHFSLEGEGIKVPYGFLTSIKGDKIKVSRDVIIGQKK